MTKPELSKAITTYEKDGSVDFRFVVIGKEVWQAQGEDGEFTSVPEALAAPMLMLFDPTSMLAGYATLDWGHAANNLGTEDKNGVRAVHVKIDPSTIGGAGLQMPAGAAIDVWIAEAGYIAVLRCPASRKARTSRSRSPTPTTRRTRSNARADVPRARRSMRAGFGRAHPPAQPQAEPDGTERGDGRSRRETTSMTVMIACRRPWTRCPRSADLEVAEADAERRHRRGVAIERRLVLEQAGTDEVQPESRSSSPALIPATTSAAFANG